jgi:4-alpha-glucanotransferase
VSPYGPTSRLYRNPLYLDVEAVPEWAAGSATPGAADALRAIDRLRDAGEIDYDAVRETKLPLLRACHAHFVRGDASERTRAYASWCAGEGDALDAFATFTALDAWLGGGTPGGDWRRWPDAYHDPASAAVASFRKDAALEIDFQRWLQFEIDRQLGAAASAGRAAGLRVGLYPDLAVGSLAGSADTWSGRARFADGVSVGAPPDAFAAGGQDWGVAALLPANLREDGYGWFAHLLRNAFRHAGALRIDHVIGLQRLFWIPEGRPASEGAYVRYPFEELLGVLALESRRARAVVIGEDLGTVSPEVAPALASWGILSSAVTRSLVSTVSWPPPAGIRASCLSQ